MKGNIIIFILLPLFSVLFSMVIVYWLIKILPKFGLVDIPGGRHIHDKITPKGGGLGIAFAFFLGWGLFLVIPTASLTGTMDKIIFYQMLAPSVMLLCVGLLDDKFNVSAYVKLGGQIIVASLCWYFDLRFDSLLGVSLNSYFSYIFTVVWILAFINAFNLIDGLDGLASGLAIVASLFMGVVFILKNEPANALVTFIFSGSCLGFLRFNFHPAKIFLGDTGSMFIGFILAVIGLVSSFKSASLSAVLIPVLASGVPVLDVILAIWRRTAKKIYINEQDSLSDKVNLKTIQNEKIACNAHKVMKGDTEHLHHRFLEKSGSQPKTTLTLYIIGVISGIIALSILLLSDRSKGLLIIVMMVVTVTTIRQLATVEMWNSTKAIIHGIHKPKRGVTVILAHPFYDLTILMGTFCLAHFLFGESGLADLLNRGVLGNILVSILPIILILNIFGTYKRYWMRASSLDYFHLFKLLVISFFISALIRFFISDGDFSKSQYAISLFQFFMAFFLIMGERLMLRYVNSTLLQKTYLKNNFHQGVSQVLLYGGGLNCYYFLNKKSKTIEDDPIKIIGIIDDYSGFRGKYLYGYKVLGGSEDLPEIVKKYKVDRVVITTENLKKSNQDTVEEFCSINKINLIEISFEEKRALYFG